MRSQYNVIKNNFVGAADGDDNHAHSFDFQADTTVKAESNLEVTEAAFNERLRALREEIDRRFGRIHPTAKRTR